MFVVVGRHLQARCAAASSTAALASRICSLLYEWPAGFWFASVLFLNFGGLRCLFASCTISGLALQLRRFLVCIVCLGCCGLMIAAYQTALLLVLPIRYCWLQTQRQLNTSVHAWAAHSCVLKYLSDTLCSCRQTLVSLQIWMDFTKIDVPEPKPCRNRYTG